VAVSERKKPLLRVHAHVERTLEADGHYVHVRLYKDSDHPWDAAICIDPRTIGGGADKVLARLELLAAGIQRTMELIREVALK